MPSTKYIWPVSRACIIDRMLFAQKQLSVCLKIIEDEADTLHITVKSRKAEDDFAKVTA